MMLTNDKNQRDIAQNIGKQPLFISLKNLIDFFKALIPLNINRYKNPSSYNSLC